ncbi:MAG: YaiO family outer membrane beta-barrel protein [Gemmatimonadota bacterium]|nr:MAG: YaiO family outer membrane beta-barrel protein [Gemmatimonadota bacterium]
MSIMRCHSSSRCARHRFAATLILCLCFAATGAAPLCSQETPAAQANRSPLSYSVEGGLALASYFDDFAHSQFVTLSISRPYSYQWRFSASLDHRFDDAGVAVGAAYTRYWSSGVFVSGGFSTGTGKSIHPEYQIGIAAGKPVLADKSLILSLSYLHTNGKGANYAHGLGLGFTWYVRGHWILGSWGRYDLSYPGTTTSWSGGLGVTYAVWRKTYMGAGLDYGDVAYMLTPGRALVEYSAAAYNVFFAQYLTSSLGFSARLDYATIYDGGGLTLRLFKEW